MQSARILQFPSRIPVPSTFADYTIGSRAWLRSALLTFRPWAILSAERTERTKVENSVATAELWADLAAARVEVIPALGCYGGSEERSYVALGLSAAAALQLGARYGQESVLLPDRLQYVDGRGFHPVAGLHFDISGPDFTRAVCDDGTLEFTAAVDFETLRA